MTEENRLVKCPHCKMEVDPTATKCPHCQEKIYRWTRGRKITAWVLLAFIVVIFTAATNSGSHATDTPATSQKTQSSSVGRGEEGHLQVSGDDKVAVLSSKELLDAFTKAAVNNDTYGMAQIFLGGGGFFVPNGTKILVIDSAFAVRQVRILEGEHIGESGWVPMEFVRK